MNKPKLRTKGYLFSAGILLISLGVLIFQACRRTEVISKGSLFTVKEAKNWWYGIYRKSAAYTETDKSSVFAAPANTSEKKYPSWKRAVSYKLGDIDVVEAPLVYETKRVLMPGMADIANTEEGNRIFKAANSKVLLFKKADGTIEVRISTLVPSKEYARKKFYDLSDIHLNNIPDDFEGYQMVRKWNEEQINTYMVQNGKLRAKQKLKKLGRGNFRLTSDRKLILNESIMAKVAADIKPATVQRSVQPQSSTKNVSVVPNIIAELIEECRLVWVPRRVEVCIIVHEEDEPAEEVCDTYESETEGDYETKCEMVWIPDEEPEDPCATYGINCPPGGGTENPNIPPMLDSIYNEVNDSCLKSMADMALNAGCKSKIVTIINGIFGNSNQVHLVINQKPLGFNGPDAFTAYSLIGVPGDMHGYFTISFNSSNNTMLESTREYIAITMFHEAIHAYIDYMWPPESVPQANADQHESMTDTAAFDAQVEAIRTLFPGMSLQDAEDLAWGGLYDTQAFKSKPLAEQQRIRNVNTDYKQAALGTPCQ